MKLTILLHILATIYLSNADDRIIGGFQANQPVPYQVSLLYYDQHICGGAVIHQYMVLTAAHCIVGKVPQYLKVVVGTNTWRSGGQRYAVAAMVHHPEYRETNGIITTVHDIGIVKTASPIAFNQRVQPINLFNGNVPDGSIMVVSGWGLTSNGGRVSEQLKILQVRSVNSAQCSQRIAINPTLICTFNSVNNGICSGDSGGPLAYNGQLVGVVSGSSENCASGIPDVFTKVALYIDWIRYNMR